MIKQVTVEELRENLDEVLSEVKSGTSITIVEEGQWIGTLGPAAAQPGDRGEPYPFRDVHVSPLPRPLTSDPVQILIDDRDGKKQQL